MSAAREGKRREVRERMEVNNIESRNALVHLSTTFHSNMSCSRAGKKGEFTLGPIIFHLSSRLFAGTQSSNEFSSLPHQLWRCVTTQREGGRDSNLKGKHLSTLDIAIRRVKFSNMSNLMCVYMFAGARKMRQWLIETERKGSDMKKKTTKLLCCLFLMLNIYFWTCCCKT